MSSLTPHALILVQTSVSTKIICWTFVRQNWRMSSKRLERKQEGKELVAHPSKPPKTIPPDVFHITLRHQHQHGHHP